MSTEEHHSKPGTAKSYRTYKRLQKQKPCTIMTIILCIRDTGNGA